MRAVLVAIIASPPVTSMVLIWHDMMICRYIKKLTGAGADEEKYRMFAGVGMLLPAADIVSH